MVIIAMTSKYAHITHLGEDRQGDFTKSFKNPSAHSRLRLHNYIWRQGGNNLVSAIVNGNGVTKYYVNR